MRTSISIIALLLVVAFAHAGEQRHISRSASFGQVVSIEVIDCDLYLYGQHVEKIAIGQKKGYRVEKTTRVVMVNSVVFASVDDPVKRIPVLSQLEQECALRDEAARQIREKLLRVGTGAYKVGTITLQIGVPTAYQVAGTTAEVMITMHGDEFRVEYAGDSVNYRRHLEPPLSSADQAEQRLSAAYDALTKKLRPGKIVLAGAGYINPYPLSRAPALRTALTELPNVVVPIQENLYGEMEYQLATVGEFTFGSGLIRDFVRQ